MPLPHIQNVTAGREYYDPMMGSIFEVVFELPQLVKTGLQTLGISDVESEIRLLTQQVTDISGLDALQKTVSPGQQKFLGVDVSFLNPALDNTYAELTVNLNLNLRNVTDAYVLRVFKLWGKLGYDLQSGTRTLKREYVAPYLKVLEANRNGVIWRIATFRDVLLTGITNIDNLDYTQNEARKLTCTFRSDYWDEEIGGGYNDMPSNYNYDLVDYENNPQELHSSAGNDVNNPGWPEQGH